MQIFSEQEFAQVLEASRDGAVIGQAEWLEARFARLIAGGNCSRQMLDAAANAGVIKRSQRGSTVVFSRSSINQAFENGTWAELENLIKARANGHAER